MRPNETVASDPLEYLPRFMHDSFAALRAFAKADPLIALADVPSAYAIPRATLYRLLAQHPVPRVRVPGKRGHYVQRERIAAVLAPPTGRPARRLKRGGKVLSWPQTTRLITESYAASFALMRARLEKSEAEVERLSGELKRCTAEAGKLRAQLGRRS